MNKKRTALWFLFLTFAILVSFLFDSRIIKTTSLIKNPFLDEIFLGVTFVSSGVIIFFFLTSMFLWKEHKRKWILPLWFTLGISVAVSFPAT